MIWSLLSFVAGLVSACGFAPLDLWPLTLAGVAFLLFAVEKAPRLRSALARGWWFGVGQFALGLNWIATAFTYQANMPAWLGWVGVVLLSFYLALFPAASAGLSWRWGRGSKLRTVLVFAAAWIVTEYLRSVLFTGFPWNPFGISLLLTPAAIFATLAGTYALSGLAALASGGLFLLTQRQWRESGAVLAGVIVLVLTAFLVAPTPTEAPGALVRVVQPNVSQDEKHEKGYGPQLRAFRRSAGNPDGEPRLLLWPEDGLPYLLDEDPLSAEEIGAWIGPRDLLLTGGFKLERDESGRAVGSRNTTWIVDPFGKILGRYDKAHLVPWGEYLPARWLLEPIGLSRIVPGDFDTWEGPGPQSFDVPGFGRIGIQICYEIVFSGKVVDRANRPDFIFNPSNDAWFGLWGPPQHFAQARLRALEEGLPVVRATPTGVTAIIDARGSIVHILPQREFGTIDARVPGAAAPTLFARFGNWLAFLFAAMLFAAAFITARLPLRSKAANERRT